MAMLCLCFSTFGQSNEPIQLTAKGIQVGQEVPDIVINNLHNYRDKKGKAVTSAKLSDFRGKLLILDFWATWCSPCVAMIPKMDSLQKVFGDRLVILPVAYQSEGEVTSFFGRMAALYPGQNAYRNKNMMVIEDKVLRQLFPNNTLPHYVWIDAKGVLRAQTGSDKVNSKSITEVLASDTFVMPMKVDDQPIAYDRKKPFLIGGNGGDGTNLLYHSVLTGYTPGLVSNFRNHPPDSSSSNYRVVLQNLPITWFYQVAYGNGEWLSNSRIRYDVRDSTGLWWMDKSVSYENWQKAGNAFCYELFTSGEMVKNTFKLMQQDLDRMFPQYATQFVMERRKCLVLTAIANTDGIYSRGGNTRTSYDATGCRMQNAEFKFFIRRLNAIYLQHNPLPFVDESGIQGKVDLQIDGNLSNIEVLNTGLAVYGLKIIEAERGVGVLVVSDR